MKELIENLTKIADDLRDDIQIKSQALSDLSGVIRSLEGREVVSHPDLPPLKKTPDVPPFKPAKPEPPELTKGEVISPGKGPYTNLTTRSSILNVLGKNRGNPPLNAADICVSLLNGGWGKRVKDPKASTSAALSGMRLELDVTKIDNISHYALFPVEDT